MNNVIYFTDLFESIPDYKKIVLLIFSIKNDVNFSYEGGFLKSDVNFLYKEFKNVLLELIEDYLDHVKNQEESSLEKFLNKQMEAYFSNLFEDIRHERSLILKLSLTYPDILKQSKFSDDEVNIIKNLAPEKLHRQKSLKECFALQLLE